MQQFYRISLLYFFFTNKYIYNTCAAHRCVCVCVIIAIKYAARQKTYAQIRKICLYKYSVRVCVWGESLLKIKTNKKKTKRDLTIEYWNCVPIQNSTGIQATERERKYLYTKMCSHWKEGRKEKQRRTDSHNINIVK